jgi:hypothetical protein
MAQNLEEANGGNFTFSAGGLAIGTTTTAYKTASTVTYTIDGAFKSRTAVDNNPLTGFGIPSLGNLQKIALAVWVDTAGALTVTNGAVVAASDNAPVPATRGGVALIGLIIISTSSSATFVPGTTALSAAGVTVVYRDCSLLPGTAQ